MSREHAKIDATNKDRFYSSLLAEAQALLDRVWFSDLANVSALLASQIEDVNWVGFYLFTEGRLQLGPFHGLPACIRIALGKGVCGTAASERRTIMVEDVDQFPGHIVCDSASRSEIVIPLLRGDRLLGVLDIDSPILARFDEQDRQGLEAIALAVVNGTTWPESFGT